jgi:hypothetical protein
MAMLDFFKKKTAASPSPSARPPASYWLTRFVLLRLLGAVYAVAFLVAANQIVPLIGARGLTPLGPVVDSVTSQQSVPSLFIQFPSLFWFNHSDAMLVGAAWAGFALAVVVAAGYANALMMLALWFLYMSFVHLGEEWYGYGWEIQLLETGFLAVFLCPLWDARPFPRRAPPTVVLWLFRWLIFRIMLGAGLIKLRGDVVWRDYTALYYHFETQPIPNGLSRWFHFLPPLVLRFGVGLNHFAELVAPWFVFWPRLARHLAGLVIVVFQLTLILSGNLSFLNWLTIVPALACLDDSFWRRILPRVLTRRAEVAAATATPSNAMQWTAWSYAGVVAFLSFPVVVNLASPHQQMNSSFDPVDLVNTYGAFGTVGRERMNVVFEGTDAATPTDSALWKPYPYKGLPVDVMKRPPQIAPYQLRLDWQMWFAAMASPAQYPFTINVVWKLLHNDPGTLSLFADNPFPDQPPRFVRARLYKYSFAPPGNTAGAYWTREDRGNWLPPLSVDNASLQAELAKRHWLDPAPAAAGPK